MGIVAESKRCPPRKNLSRLVFSDGDRRELLVDMNQKPLRTDWCAERRATRCSPGGCQRCAGEIGGGRASFWVTVSWRAAGQADAVWREAGLSLSSTSLAGLAAAGDGAIGVVHLLVGRDGEGFDTAWTWERLDVAPPHDEDGVIDDDNEQGPDF